MPRTEEIVERGYSVVRFELAQGQRISYRHMVWQFAVEAGEKCLRRLAHMKRDTNHKSPTPNHENMLYYLHHTEQEQRVQSEEIKRLVAKSENDAVEFKRARVGVPADFWPQYSSFANTDGIERTME